MSFFIKERQAWYKKVGRTKGQLCLVNARIFHTLSISSFLHPLMNTIFLLPPRVPDFEPPFPLLSPHIESGGSTRECVVVTHIHKTPSPLTRYLYLVPPWHLIFFNNISHLYQTLLNSAVFVVWTEQKTIEGRKFIQNQNKLMIK